MVGKLNQRNASDGEKWNHRIASDGGYIESENIASYGEKWNCRITSNGG